MAYVNPPPKPREAGLVRRVVVGCPLEMHGIGWAILEGQPAWLEDIAAEPTGEIGAARYLGEYFRSTATKGTVPRCKARKGWRHEGTSLIGDPVDRTDPTKPADLIFTVSWLATP